ncbi:hypothetical protein H7X46_00780 [Pseudonocardia sp. C8]|uniref:hypothetical protein n=1 Tax=Pseudonocardia sp. C8 TaxID=2762759 RepID=UPI00164352B7|nr:hypothetical protein [Pseudonocardia sp. C8]MBC3189601.1 hypothetical protein [Pseudonocardia sp. C8]
MRRITRAGLRAVGLLAATGALCAAAVVPAVAAEPGTTWQPELTGNGTGVVVDGGAARFDRATAFGAPAGESSNTEAVQGPVDVVPTGLLTLAPRTLDAPTREVGSTLVADTPPGSSATVDIRGRKAGGGWTEWIPADGGRAELPQAVREVQGRLVLTSTGNATPVVRAVTLSAAPTAEAETGPLTEAAPRAYSVFATREGLVGGTTANGHKIVPRDRFVALPSRRALSGNGKTDYSVKVCAANGRCAIAPVWDIGPWNTKDDYWNPPHQREMWKDLPQGVPQAAAARNGHNGGKDQFGRRVANPAGIDLGDGIFWDVLGLKDNSQVHVEYLWTGSQRLSAVRAEGAPEVPILARPEAGAESVGIAVNATDVPVQCRHGEFVRIGEGQYLPTTAFGPLPADLPGCDGAAPGPGARPAAGAAAAPTGSAVPGTPAAGTPGTAPAGSPGTPPAGAPGTSPAGTAPAGTAPAGTAPAGSPGTPPGTPPAGAAFAPGTASSGDRPAAPAPRPGEPARVTSGTPSPGGTPTADARVPAGDSQAAAAPRQPGSSQRAPSGTR